MSEPDYCPECGNRHIVFDSSQAEYICKECGLVIEESKAENGYVARAIQKRARNPYIINTGSKETHGRIVKHSWLLSTREKNLKKRVHNNQHASRTAKSA